MVGQRFARERRADALDPRLAKVRCEAAEDDDVEDQEVRQQRARGAHRIAVRVDRRACDRIARGGTGRDLGAGRRVVRGIVEPGDPRGRFQRRSRSRT
jgi:hypothetical protein